MLFIHEKTFNVSKVWGTYNSLEAAKRALDNGLIRAKLLGYHGYTAPNKIHYPAFYSETNDYIAAVWMVEFVDETFLQIERLYLTTKLED